MRRDTYVVGGIAVAAIIIGASLSLYGGNGFSNTSPSAAIENQPAAVIVPFTKLAQGVKSTVSTRTNYLITSASEFTKLWQMVDAKGKVPAVDFTKNDVVAVFAGQKMTGGYEITVSKVEDTNVRNVVVTLAKPGSDCVLTQSTIAPYQIIEIPKTTLTFAHIDQDTTINCSQ